MYELDGFDGKKYDRINKIIDSYNHVQNGYINLEACCSYPFNSVMEAHIYPIYTLPAEGAGTNYFPLFESMIEIESYAEEILLKMLNTDSNKYRVSLQPHSGTQANHIIYNAILNDDDDVVLSLDPKDGGHVSHNQISFKNVIVKNYHITDNNQIDYLLIEELADKYKPKLIIVGTSSYTGNIDFKKVAEIAHKHNSFVLADVCHYILYILGKTHQSPIPYVDFITFTLDKTLRGPQGGVLVYRADLESKINRSIFPLTQGGPLQTLQFSKLVNLVELNNMDISTYANDVLRNTSIMNTVLVENGIHTLNTTINNHIILVDTTKYDMLGIEAEKLFYDNMILVNKNLIPNDINNPSITSGIRIGTICVTNLNYSENDLNCLSINISKLLKNYKIEKLELYRLISKYHSSINISNLEITKD